MFTRQHYIYLAKAIHPAVVSGAKDHLGRKSIAEMLTVLCAALKADNPAFNKDRFLEACRYGKVNGRG